MKDLERHRGFADTRSHSPKPMPRVGLEPTWEKLPLAPQAGAVPADALGIRAVAAGQLARHARIVDASPQSTHTTDDEWRLADG